MIQKIRTLWRKIVPRKALATQSGRDKHEAETVMNRRVQVTVERETVSMWVRGKPAEGAGGRNWEQDPEVQHDGGNTKNKSKKRRL